MAKKKFRRLKKSYRGRRKGDVFVSQTREKRNPLQERLVQNYLQSCSRGEPCRILFVCTANRERSPAAERLVKKISRLEVKSAGLATMEGLVKGVRQLTFRLVKWSDLIFVMSPQHKRVIIKYVPTAKQKIIVLNIPDTYTSTYDPKLKRLLRQRLSKYFPELRN